KVVVPPLAHDATQVMVRFSPDGHRVVTASIDGTARVWSADTGARQLALAHSPGIALTGAGFSPGGARLVTTGADAKLRIWSAGVDNRSLEDWRRIARDGSFPQLAETLDRLAPASRIVHP